jgi:uncharacterized protein YciI
MRWVVIFDDAPDMMSVRREREPLHLAFLEQHRDSIRIAGGLRENPGGSFVGGLWVVEADSRDQVDALVAADPYYVPAHRKYRVLTWGKALPDPVTL